MEPDVTGLNQNGDIPIRRKRGRPTGSKNRIKQPTAILNNAIVGERQKAPTLKAFDIYAADPLAMTQRFYSELDFRLTALTNARKMKPQSKIDRGLQMDEQEIPLLTDVANVLLKAMQAHDKALSLAERLSKNKSPAELLEIAVIKIMGQDLATIRSIIKRLRDHVGAVAPSTRPDKIQMGDLPNPNAKTAAQAFAELGEDDAV